MKPLVTLVALCIVCPGVLADPATTPSAESLMHGDLSFTTPDGWKMEGRTNDGRRIGYSHANPKAVMLVNVDPQLVVLPDNAAGKIGVTVIKQIKDNAAANNIGLTMPPKIETDDRFFLRVHHKFAKEAESADQLQIYRVIGLDLVACAVTVFSDSPDEVKSMFSDAEKTLLSVKPSHGAAAAAHPVAKPKPATRPTALPNARIAFNGPAGWDEQTNDNASGIVATYHDPADTFTTLVVSVRPLPPEAKKDPKVRDALVEEIVNGQKASFKFDGASVVGDSETVKDNRFLKKERTRYEKADARIVVTARQRRVGDVIVSVAMAAVEPAATDVDRLADEVAMSVRPVR